MGSFRLSCTLTLLLGLSASAHAQDLQAPPHVVLVDGAASIDREGQTEQATGNMPLLSGDRLYTANGRTQVMFPDGSILDLDEYSSVEVQSPTLLRLTAGRLILTVAGVGDPGSALRYQIDTPVASATIDGPGEYRLAIFTGPSGLETELAVTRGYAALSTERGSVPLRAGERSLARDLFAPDPPQLFNSARFDAFDRWSAAQRDARLGTRSAQYLPRDLRMYGGTFDRYGAWQYEAPYGYVWYPGAAPGWRPYFHGYWASLRPYGWTWIGLDFWAWPTHHYGRWGYARSRWFWIPDRRWGPAWVTWASAPGYVSWCPLGFDNRAVFGLSVSIHDRWNGWVVAPRSHFGAHRVHVRDYAVAAHRLPAATPFVGHAAAPAAPRHVVGQAVPRGGVGPRTEGLAVVGGRARAVGAPPALPPGDRGAFAARRSGAGRQPLAGVRGSPLGNRVETGPPPRAYQRGRAPGSAPAVQPDTSFRGMPRSPRRDLPAPRPEYSRPARAPYAMPRGAMPRGGVATPPPQVVAPAPRSYEGPAPRRAPSMRGSAPPAQPSAPPAQLPAPPVQRRVAPAHQAAPPSSQPRGPVAVPRGAPRSGEPSRDGSRPPTGNHSRSRR